MSKWTTWPTYWGPNYRPNGFVLLTAGAKLRVTGTSNRLEACLNFMNVAVDHMTKTGDMPKLDLERDPTNTFDPAAIKVIGKRPDFGSYHLGFLPADFSQMMLARFTPDMPIAVELREWGQTYDDTAVFFTINVLAPKKRKRWML